MNLQAKKDTNTDNSTDIWIEELIVTVHFLKKAADSASCCVIATELIDSALPSKASVPPHAKSKQENLMQRSFGNMHDFTQNMSKSDLETWSLCACCLYFRQTDHWNAE